eukprot:764358-Prymnesium_polylepis.1
MTRTPTRHTSHASSQPSVRRPLVRRPLVRRSSARRLFARWQQWLGGAVGGAVVGVRPRGQ